MSNSNALHLNDEPEETKRRLVSELMPLLCRFGWHTWTKWETTGEGVREIAIFNSSQPILFQETKCIHCDKVKQKVVSYS